MATLREASEFLDDFRRAIQNRRDAGKTAYQFRQTEKNIQGLSTLGGLNENDALFEIFALTGECYCQGPEPDRDEDNKEIWVFGCAVGDKEVYIKLRLDQMKPVPLPVIRSFHPAEYPITYPHKKGGGK